jgi:hypothetical protein
MGKKFDEQMICNCSLSRKWWWGSIKVFDSPTKFLVYLDKEGSIDFDQANVKKVTVAYLCNRIDDGGGEFEGTDSHWAVCEPTANGAFAVWEINLSNLYSDPPSPEMVCPEQEVCWRCKGFRQISLMDGTNKNTICPVCKGTKHIPSPEPPEKVSEVIAEWLYRKVFHAPEDFTWQEATNLQHNWNDPVYRGTFMYHERISCL